MKLPVALAVLLLSASDFGFTNAFVPPSSAMTTASLAAAGPSLHLPSTATAEAETESSDEAPSLEQRREEEKRKLLGMIGRRSSSSGDNEDSIPEDRPFKWHVRWIGRPFWGRLFVVIFQCVKGSAGDAPFVCRCRYNLCR